MSDEKEQFEIPVLDVDYHLREYPEDVHLTRRTFDEILIKATEAMIYVDEIERLKAALLDIKQTSFDETSRAKAHAALRVNNE